MPEFSTHIIQKKDERDTGKNIYIFHGMVRERKRQWKCTKRLENFDLQSVPLHFWKNYMRFFVCFLSFKWALSQKLSEQKEWNLSTYFYRQFIIYCMSIFFSIYNTELKEYFWNLHGTFSENIHEGVKCYK